MESLEEDIKIFLVNSLGGQHLIKSSDDKKRNEKLDQVDIDRALKLGEILIKKIPRQINPKQFQKYHYLTIDSDNRDSENSTSTKLSWNVLYNASDQKTGVINTSFPIKNIIAMRLGQLTYTNAHVTEYDEFTGENPRYAIELKNFGSQALQQQDKRLHFLLKQNTTAKLGNHFTFSPFGNNRGWFRFSVPIRRIEQLIMSMFNPLTGTQISFPETKLSFTATQKFDSVDIYSPPTIAKTIVNPLIIPDAYKEYIDIMYNPAYEPDPSAPDYTTGGPARQQYTLSGFTTDDPVGDASVIAAYNTTHSLTLFADKVYFNSPVDISSITYAGTDISVAITWIYNPRVVAALEVVTRS